MKSLYQFVMESFGGSEIYNLSNESNVDVVKSTLKSNGLDVDIDENSHTITAKKLSIYDNNRGGKGSILSLHDGDFLRNSKHIYLIPTKEWTIKAKQIIFSTYSGANLLDTSNINIDKSGLKQVQVLCNMSREALRCLDGIKVEQLFVQGPNIAQHINADQVIYDWSGGGRNEIPFAGEPNIGAKQIVIWGLYHYPFWKGPSKVYIKTQVDNTNCEDCSNILVDFIKANSGASIIVCANTGNGFYTQLGAEDNKLTFNPLGTNNLKKAFQNCK